MIKIVAIDMDGTLLNNEGKVTERNAAAIRKYLWLLKLFVLQDFPATIYV